MKIAHILVTSDLSPEAVRPFAAVRTLAQVLGARVTLLHVTEDIPLAPMGVGFEPVMISPDIQTRMDLARTQLAKQAAALEGVELTVDVVAGTEVVRTIAEYVQANDVDLIAMSTHGRTGFRHWVLGSVAEAVLRRSPVPVVVFPPEEKAEAGKKP